MIIGRNKLIGDVKQLKIRFTNALILEEKVFFIVIARIKLQIVKDSIAKILETNSFIKMLENKQREEENSEIDIYL